VRDTWIETLNAGASTILTRENCRRYALRRLTDDGRLEPPHATLECGEYGDVHAPFAVLYDGRIAVATTCTAGAFWRDTYVAVWDPERKDADRLRSVRVAALDRSQMRTLWQLPSYARDHETCKTVLRRELELLGERALIDLIVAYSCLPTSALARRYGGKRHSDVELAPPTSGADHSA